MELIVIATTEWSRRRRIGSRRIRGTAMRWMLTLLTAAGAAHADDSIRCGNRIVERGRPQAEVEQLCGAPSYRDRRIDARSPYGNTYDMADVWYYNRGPGQLIRELVFRDGRLDDVQSDGYGFVEPQTHQCQPSDIVVGMSKYRLVTFCGEPLSKQAMNIEAPVVMGPRAGLPRGGAWVTPVYREQWVYNFGPSYFMREVTIDNGTVTEIHNGDRGYRPH
jgi:hypothetical protein